MSELLDTAKNLTPIAVPFITQVINTFLKPKLEEMHKNKEISKNISEYNFGNKFEEYLTHSYKKYSCMNTIVFANQPKSIELLYIPLTVSTVDAKGKEISLKLNDYKEEFIPTYKRVLITDTAGMGKSTSVKWLFLSCIKNQKGIPIFVELRRLSKGRGIIDEIHKELNPIDDEFNKDFILKLIKRGDFIFFFDGYDEIPLNDREEATENLQDFISKAGNNLFVITSRPESALASFGDFQQFSIQPLKKEEAYELIRKYDISGNLAEELIRKLEEEQNIQNLHEFLSNPLLVSLLFKAYWYKPIIPTKKHTFYRQVYDALFEGHDLTKGGSFVHQKHSGLDVEDFHRVLRSLGFFTFRQGKVEFDKDELVLFVKESKKNCPRLEFKESDFIKDLVITVPLLNKEGIYYKWSHKSIQEYFVAQFIFLDAKDKQESILKQMYKSPKISYYINVLDLYYDIDYKIFRKVIILDLVNEFIKYCDTTYTQIDKNQIRESDIIERRSVTFNFAFALLTNDSANPKVVSEKLKAYIIPKKGNAILFGSKPFANYTMFYMKSSIYPILELMYSKNEDVVKLLLLHDSKTKLNIVAKEYPFIPLDDNPNSPINSKYNFVKVTKSLLAVEEDIYLLNYEKCKALRDQIQEELNQAQYDDFLLE